MDPDTPDIDDGFALEDWPFDDEEQEEVVVSLDSGLGSLEAALVFREDELSHLELLWPQGGDLPGPPLSTEVVGSVLERAGRTGYPLRTIFRRAAALDEGARFVERHYVMFEPEPAAGDGTGVSLELYLGIDLDDDDFETPLAASKARDAWVARIAELIGATYGKARVTINVVDNDSEEVRITLPTGLDSTDFEWRIDELIEQASAEILEVETADSYRP